MKERTNNISKNKLFLPAAQTISIRMSPKKKYIATEKEKGTHDATMMIHHIR
jgi:hypothetical protein